MPGNQKQQQNNHQLPTLAKTKRSEPKAVKNINPKQMISAPETLRSEDILAAQQQVGNQVVQRALDKKAHHQGLTDGQGNLQEDISAEIQKKRGGGSPLPDSVQKEASKKLGRSFRDVRIHTDDKADKLSRTINARAFTIGSDVFFKGGVFSPTSSAGRETILHELTHVVQQSGGSKRANGALKLGAPDTAMEKEAAHMGKKYATSATSAVAASGAVQRVEEEEVLQGQPDTSVVIQRVEEEEVLQGQPDTSLAIQRVEEEEVLQGQPDTSLTIQRNVEEEEVLQGQPDTGSVIQREEKADDPNLKKAKEPSVEPPKENLDKPKKHHHHHKSHHHGTKIPKAPPLPEGKDLAPAKSGFSAEIAKKSKALKTNKQSEGLAKLESDRSKKVGERLGGQFKEDQATKPKSTKEKVGSFFKSAGKGMLSAGKTVGKGLLSAGKYVGNKAGSYLKSRGDEALNQFLGIKGKDEDEDKDDDKKKEKGKKGGSKESGGGGGMAETISDLFQENKKLKSELTELKKKKEEVPVN